MDMETLVALCRRRGFIFQSSEIYGGINGFWDYGPMGVELKNNIKRAWWLDMVQNPPLGPDGKEIQMVGVDCSIIMNPKVWEASGHVGGFQDPMSSCKFCRKLYRSDQVWDQLIVSAWVTSLLDLYNPAEASMATGADLLKWAKGKGKRLAPNLALVRNPDVTLSWMSEEAERRGGKIGFTDAREWIMAFATEQQGMGQRIVPCPACGGDLTEPRFFNLMFESHAGAVKDDAAKVYLRPETAQGIFVNFKNVLDTSRMKLPFGIAQIGKAFRNEVNPRNFIFRSREFEQMEIEFFCHPDDSMKWYEYWRDVRKSWYTTLGIRSERLRPREQEADERAFYSVGTTDIEYLFPFSDEPQELEGVAHRSDYDLKAHQEKSGRDLTYFDEDLWQKDQKKYPDKKEAKAAKSKPPYRFIPHVVEPSAGVDRFTLATLCEAYSEDEVGGEKRVVLRFHPRLAPIKAAIFPLVNKDGMPEKAFQLYRELKSEFNVFYDDKGAVGRRYRRQDETGTPYTITVDGQTMEDDTVTIRDRDTTEQKRIAMSEVGDVLRRRLKA